MSYADDLVTQWEMNDPRDRWRHTGEQPPSTRSNPIKGWKPTEDQERDTERMLVCDVCGGNASAGFGVTLEGVTMGDIGSWRCAEHHPHRQATYTREDWAKINETALPVDMPQEFCETEDAR